MNAEAPIDSVDGVPVPMAAPPPAPPAVKTKAAAVATPPPPPALLPEQGGTSGDTGEGAALVHAMRESYRATGQSTTGSTYARWARHFLDYLGDQKLSLSTMPGDAAATFLTATHNPITHNIGVTALNTFFRLAAEKGAAVVPQTMTRMKTNKKRKEPPATAGVPMSNDPFNSPYQTMPVGASPAPIPPTPPAPPVQQVVMQRPVQPTLPQQPQQQAAHQNQHPYQQQQNNDAFRSLGRRVRISKLSGAQEYGVAPGQLYVIGIYDKALIEAEGSLENFLMFRIRPSVGPKAGEAPVVYRAENLDTSGRPLQGQFWDVPIVADPLASAAPSAQPAQQFLPQPQQTTPNTAMERMLEIAFAQQKEAQTRYDSLQQQLMAKRNDGKLDDTTLMLLLERNKPAPVDLEAIKRSLKEEMRTEAPAPLPASPAPMFGGGGGLFDMAPPRADPAIDRLAALMEKQADMTNQMMMRLMTPPPAPPQKDPMEVAMAMLTMMNGRTDPLKDELAKLTLANLASPAKSKPLQEILGDLAAIQKFTAAPERNATFMDQLTDLVGVVVENGDKVGEMLGRMRSGALRAAMAPPAPAQLPAQTRPAPQPVQAAPQQQVQQTQPGAQIVAHPEAVVISVKALVARLRGGDVSREADIHYVEGLMDLLRQLDASGSPWKEVSAKVLDLYKQANTRLDIKGTVLNLFRWIRVLIEKEALIDHLVTVLHRNYSTIYGLITDGQQKVLSDAEPEPEQNSAEEDGKDEERTGGGEEDVNASHEGEAEAELTEVPHVA